MNKDKAPMPTGKDGALDEELWQGLGFETYGHGKDKLLPCEVESVPRKQDETFDVEKRKTAVQAKRQWLANSRVAGGVWFDV
jgi:hypothetical protein